MTCLVCQQDTDLAIRGEASIGMSGPRVTYCTPLCQDCLLRFDNPAVVQVVRDAIYHQVSLNQKES